MTDLLFGFLESIGFTHPLHPALTHIPMGMVIGCFLFGLVGFYSKNMSYFRSALHCSVVALIFIVPTIVAGFLDWQHFFGSMLSIYFIIKFVLAVVLTVLLAVSVWRNVHGASAKELSILYTLCLACAGGLGFSGGEVIYGG